MILLFSQGSVGLPKYEVEKSICSFSFHKIFIVGNDEKTDNWTIVNFKARWIFFWLQMTALYGFMVSAEFGCSISFVSWNYLYSLDAHMCETL